MPAVIYNQYLIVAVAKQEEFAGAWCVSVDITSRQAGRPISSFETTRHEFETQAQAEHCGLNLARAWIDQRLGGCRAEADTPVPERRPPLVMVPSVGRIQGRLRTDLQEFAEKMEEILGKDEKKRNDSWAKSSLEDLVHDVLDNTSALLMTNYNNEAERAALQETCLDLAILAFIIRRKSIQGSKTQPERAAEQIDTRPQAHHSTGDASAAEKREGKRAAVRQLRPTRSPVER